MRNHANCFFENLVFASRQCLRTSMDDYVGFDTDSLDNLSILVQHTHASKSDCETPDGLMSDDVPVGSACLFSDDQSEPVVSHNLKRSLTRARAPAIRKEYYLSRDPGQSWADRPTG